MKLFRKLKSKDNTVTLEQLKKENIKQKYFAECRFIWKNYVPQSGQSDVLQGELLRQIEKLRFEAQSNGNINWDEDFSWFCDFIKETLCAQSIYSAGEKAAFTRILSYIQECGGYARKFADGQIPDEELDVEKIAYTEDNLYDILSDAVGKLQAHHPEPIPYAKNNEIYR